MKFLFAILIVAIIGANASYIPKHLTIIGKLDHKDLNDPSKIIGMETIYLNPSPPDTVEKVIIFPEPESSIKVENIQAVAWYDSVSEPSELSIIGGGINQTHITLYIRSLPGRGIDSLIRFYGKKE